jgi:hypothetical protein
MFSFITSVPLSYLLGELFYKEELEPERKRGAQLWVENNLNKRESKKIYIWGEMLLLFVFINNNPL